MGRRRFASALVLVAVLAGAGCKKKGDGAPAGGAQGTCEAACAHRASCNLPGVSDAATCTADCQALAAVLTPEGLAAYVKGSCDDVKVAESGFQTAVSCRAACAHRASCLPETASDKECISGCLALGGTNDEVVAYTKASCEEVKQQEPTFQAARACIAGCQHAAKCQVEGDVEQCLPWCLQNIKAGNLKTDTAVAFAKTDCVTAKQQLRLPAKGAAPAPVVVQGDRAFSPYLYIGRGCTGGGPPAPPGGMPGPTYDCPGFSFTGCCVFGQSRPARYGERGTCAFTSLCLFRP